jgi:hypothetical protein
MLLGRKLYKKKPLLLGTLGLARVKGGWAIAQWTGSEWEPLSYPFEDKLKARQFLKLTRPDLGWVPSILPHIEKRINKERA